MRQNGSNPRVLFIGRKNCDLSNQLYEHIIDCDFSVKAVFPSQRGESFVKQVEEWATKWGMKFNALKCYKMTVTNKKIPINRNYKINNTIMQNEDKIKYLGVIIDKK